MTMNTPSSIALFIIFTLGTSLARADIASELKRFTGQHTRMVWSENIGDGRDFMCKTTDCKLVGIDTDDGKGIRVIRGTLDSYTQPLITPNGDRIVYTNFSTGKVHIIHWDGSGDKILASGYATDVWIDPDSGIEYATVRTDTYSPKAPIVRYALDDPSSFSTIWNKTSSGSQLYGAWFQMSADGKRAAGTFPWGKAGIAYLPNKSWTRLIRGCWTSIAPDNSYDSWVFQDDHRTVHVYDANNKHKGVLDLHTAPGIRGWEIYHPKWTSDPNYITITGPYDAKAGGSCPSHNCGNLIAKGGNRMNVYIGRLDKSRTRVTRWLQVTDNKVPEFFGDAWIGSGPPKPLLGLNSSGLQFVANMGGSAPAAQTVTIDGLYGLDVHDLRVTESAPWLNVSVAGSGNSRTLRNWVSIDGLAAGTKRTTVTVTVAGHSKQYPVSLSVTDPANYHQKINFGNNRVPGWLSGSRYTKGGVKYTATTGIATAGVRNAAPQAVYQSCERDGFDFNIPIANGQYTVRLHIAEPYWNTAAESAKSRAIDIKLEGVLVEDNLDPAAVAGGVKKAGVIDHQITVADGNLNMNVIRDAAGDDAFVMGVEIFGGKAARTR